MTLSDMGSGMGPLRPAIKAPQTLHGLYLDEVLTKTHLQLGMGTT